jgi:hypothetical protein
MTEFYKDDKRPSPRPPQPRLPKFGSDAIYLDGKTPEQLLATLNRLPSFAAETRGPGTPAMREYNIALKKKQVEIRNKLSQAGYEVSNSGVSSSPWEMAPMSDAQRKRWESTEEAKQFPEEYKKQIIEADKLAEPKTSTKPPIPSIWGDPPSRQTADRVQLPDGTMGSSTMRKWMEENIEKHGTPKEWSGTTITNTSNQVSAPPPPSSPQTQTSPNQVFLSNFATGSNFENSSAPQETKEELLKQIETDLQAKQKERREFLKLPEPPKSRPPVMPSPDGSHLGPDGWKTPRPVIGKGRPPLDKWVSANGRPPAFFDTRGLAIDDYRKFGKPMPGQNNSGTNDQWKAPSANYQPPRGDGNPSDYIFDPARKVHEGASGEGWNPDGTPTNKQQQREADARNKPDNFDSQGRPLPYDRYGRPQPAYWGNRPYWEQQAEDAKKLKELAAKNEAKKLKAQQASAGSLISGKPGAIADGKGGFSYPKGTAPLDPLDQITQARDIYGNEIKTADMVTGGGVKLQKNQRADKGKKDFGGLQFRNVGGKIQVVGGRKESVPSGEKTKVINGLLYSDFGGQLGGEMGLVAAPKKDSGMR